MKWHSITVQQPRAGQPVLLSGPSLDGEGYIEKGYYNHFMEKYIVYNTSDTKDNFVCSEGGTHGIPIMWCPILPVPTGDLDV